MPNITMSIDGELLKKARKVAIDRETSLTGLVRKYLEELVEKEEVLKEMAANELESLFLSSEAIVGEKTWTREGLHVRW